MTPPPEPNPALKPPNPWTAFWQTLIRFEKEKIAPGMAVRNTLGVVIPLAAGAALGHMSAALAVASGALNVSFIDSDEPYGRRTRRMLAGCVLVSAAVCAGATLGASHVLTVLFTAVWALAAGILVAAGTTAADLGLISLVILIVFGAEPLPPRQAIYAGMLAFGGGLFQLLLSLSAWPLQRYGPERRILSELYLELAHTAAAAEPGTVDASQAPPASAKITQAQQSLAALGREHSVEAERHRLLLSQAERMAMGLLTLRRLRSRIRRKTPDACEIPLVDRFFAGYAQQLESVGAALQSSAPAAGDPGVRDLQEVAEQMRAARGLAGELRGQMDALNGQLRTARELASVAPLAGRNDFVPSEAAQPWQLKLSGSLATLRANLTLESAAARHAIRLAACVALGEAVGRAFGVERAYWFPMTIAIVLKPDFTATFSRGVLRLAGTFAGLAIATALFGWLPMPPAAQIVLVGVSLFLVRGWGPANYGVFVTALTAMVVLLLSLHGYRPQDVAGARAWNTVAGGVVALLAYAVWPTWERTQVPEALAKMLDGYRLYFRAIREVRVSPQHADAARLASRLARTNLEASIDRLFAEPGTTSATTSALSGVLASSHRLLHALISLEAGLAAGGQTGPGFDAFANHVETSLFYLAGILRGSRLGRADLPDLREDHYALVQAGENSALVRVETDRITNSINTMAEELFRWRSLLKTG